MVERPADVVCGRITRKMPPDVRQIITMTVFLFATALCMWRRPKADRGHVMLCVIAAALWVGLLFFEPRTRTVMYGITVATFLLSGLSVFFQHRFHARP
jgi:hypothetical protein